MKVLPFTGKYNVWEQLSKHWKGTLLGQCMLVLTFFFFHLKNVRSADTFSWIIHIFSGGTVKNIQIIFYCTNFFSIALISFCEKCGVSKNAPGNAGYRNTLRYLWTAETCFRFWVTTCWHHSSHGWYITLFNDGRREAKGYFLHGENRKREADDASEPTHEAWSDKHQRSRREGSVCGTTCTR